ncbi:MAG: glycerol-3-phosphate dehydrogenase [Oscillospiraceae bacterium]|nr:glycerol-3-phosphate dehydrogenase [Oscillospiraceae bacterium]
MAVITVIGAGAMGSAMSVPGRENGHEVRLVGTMLDREIISHAQKTGEHTGLGRKLPEGVLLYQLEGLEKALGGADLIIGGVSSFGVQWFRDEVIPKLPPEIPVLSVTKGMMDMPDGSLLTYPELYEQTAPGRAFCAIGGPCTSYELADRDQTAVVFCGRDEAVLNKLRSLLQTSFYHISISTDVRGVECAVAMKNAYALGVTAAAGLSEARDGKLHYNSQAALFGQSIKEMRKLLALCGGHDDNIIYGAGDLYVTIFGGRTRRLGMLLGKGLSFDEAIGELSGITLESVVIATRTGRAVRKLIEQGKASAADFPLLLHIYDIINRGAQVDIPWEKFTC